MAPPENFTISAWVLSADCDGGPSGVCSNAIPLQDCLGCNRDGYLGTTNQTGYDFSRINTQWVSPTVDTDGKTMKWYNATFKVWTRVDLTTLFSNEDGKLCLTPKVPAVIFVPPGDIEDKMKANLKKNVTDGRFKNVEYQDFVSLDGTDHYRLFYAKGSLETTGLILKTYNAKAEASVMQIFQEKGIPLEQVDFKVLGGEVAAQWGTYFGFDASINLVSGQVSLFDVSLGLGVGTGIGIHDESFELKVLGSGFSVGRRVGISVIGSKFVMDFGLLLPE